MKNSRTAPKTYTASVKDKRTGFITIIESVYNSKADFAADLRRNGFAVRFICLPEQFDEACAKYHNAIHV